VAILRAADFESTDRVLKPLVQRKLGPGKRLVKLQSSQRTQQLIDRQSGICAFSRILAIDTFVIRRNCIEDDAEIPVNRGEFAVERAACQ
jgi:hypothetical protein